MDLWPGDYRSPESIIRKEKKGKSKYGGQLSSYPLLEHDAVTSASLRHDGGRLEWTFPNVNDDSARKVVAARGSRAILPSTLPLPLPPSSTTATQRINHTTEFLHLHYSDAEFASDLIGDIVEADTKDEAIRRTYDPFPGNVLSIASPKGSSLVYLAFPVGETGSDLNVSPLHYDKKDGVTLRPFAQSACVFKTPIQQIVSSPSDAFNQGSALAVRTLGTIHILKLVCSRRGCHAEEVKMAPYSEIGNRPIVDVIFPVSSGDQTLSILADDCGGVYKLSVPETSGPGHHVIRAQEIAVAPPGFFRLARGLQPTSYLLLSHTALQELDFRTAPSDLDLFSLSDSDEVFTSLEGPGDDRLIRALTTTRILWIDERYPKRPVFAVKHGRQSDHNLHLRSMTFDNTPISFLTSHRNSLVTLYDVSRGEDNFVHLNAPPYALPAFQTLDPRTRGEIFFHHPADRSNTTAVLMRMSERGSLHQMDLILAQDGSSQDCVPPEPVAVEWSPEIRELTVSGSHRMDPGPLGWRNAERADLSGAYQRLFCEEGSEEDPEAVHNLLDVMPIFWQSHDGPLDQALTTFDIAFRSGDEHPDVPRADFFVGSALNSVRGYRALVQGRIPRDQLIRHSPWHYDIAPALSRFLPDMSKDPAELATRLGKYDLVSTDDRPAPSYRTEIRAREQLALDLVLSSDIFTPGFRDKEEKADEDDPLEAMSRATEVMSLNLAEPPEVSFGFFRPEKKQDGKFHFGQTSLNPTDDSNSSLCPLGVRLLLDEWKTGSDPGEYTYEDPYDVVPSTREAPRPQPQAQPRLSAVNTPVPRIGSVPPTSQSQRPPAVAPTTSGPPPIANSQPAAPHLPASQPVTMRDTFGGSQPAAMEGETGTNSQNVQPSTQILHGPHGGRSQPGKKKPVKKRIGGF